MKNTCKFNYNNYGISYIDVRMYKKYALKKYIYLKELKVYLKNIKDVTYNAI